MLISFVLLIIASYFSNTGEDYGACYGFSFVYSGNFLAEVELDQSEQVRFVMGIADENFSFIINHFFSRHI